jgi:hypothetical protein
MGEGGTAWEQASAASVSAGSAAAAGGEGGDREKPVEGLKLKRLRGMLAAPQVDTKIVICFYNYLIEGNCVYFSY